MAILFSCSNGGFKVSSGILNGIEAVSSDISEIASHILVCKTQPICISMRTPSRGGEVGGGHPSENKYRYSSRCFHVSRGCDPL